MRIPTESLETTRSQCGSILALATAIIENATPGGYDAEPDHKLHGLRQFPSDDRRFVSSDFDVLLIVRNETMSAEGKSSLLYSSHPGLARADLARVPK